MAEDHESANLLVQTTAKSGTWSVRFRKGDEKDIFVEVWSSRSSKALHSSLKVTDKLTKVYNDENFGGITWS